MKALIDTIKQTVAEIREWHKAFGSHPKLNSTVMYALNGKLLEITDHLQKNIETLTKERDEARAIANKQRDGVLGYKFGNAIYRDDFPDSERMLHPWEKP